MRKGNMTIIASILAISLVSVAFGAATLAYFSDTETSHGNTFTAGTLDLVLDIHDPVTGLDETYNGENMQIFDLVDVKPGDHGEVTISLHVENDAWIWADFSIAEDSENGLTEPELDLLDTEPDGELAANLDIFIWWDTGPDGIPGTGDPGEGDNIWQLGEGIFHDGKQIDLPGGMHGPFFIPGCKTVYMGIEWSVDLSVGNIIQSDKLVTDTTFYVEQHKNNPSPVGP